MFDQFIYVRWEYTAVHDGKPERRPISALLLDRERLQSEPGTVYTCVLHRDSLAPKEGYCGVCRTLLERVLYSYQMATTTIPLVAGEVTITNPPLIDYTTLLVGVSPVPPAEPPKQPDPKPKRKPKPKAATEPVVVLAKVEADEEVLREPAATA